MQYIIFPFAWLLRVFIQLFNSYGLALIFYAFIVKVIFLFFSAKSKKSMLKNTRLQPKMKELEKRYAGNKEKYNEEVQKLYKENDVKMMSGCLWSIIPLVFIMLLYQVVIMPLTHIMQLSADQITAVTNVLTQFGYNATNSGAYSYPQIQMAEQIFLHFDAVKAVVPQVMKIDFSFLGINLAVVPDYKFFLSGFSLEAFGRFLIPLVSAALAFLSTKVSMMGTDPATQQNQKSMMLMGPVMSLIFGFIMPAGLGVYWIAQSTFQMIQDYFLGKHYIKVLDAEDAVRLERQRALEEERERKRIEYERLKAENANQRNKNTSKKKVQKVERLEAEKKSSDFEKKKSGEPEPPKPEIKVDSSRPFARGRAFDPNRIAETEALLKVQDEEAAKKAAEEAAKKAAEEAERRDQEKFEKFLATGKIEDDDDADDADSDNTLSGGENSGEAADK